MWLYLASYNRISCLNFCNNIFYKLAYISKEVDIIDAEQNLNFRILTMCLSQDLTLKAPRKSASENVVCLCHLLHLLANFSNLHFAYRQTVWTQIRLLLKEQSDLGPHCLQQ